MEPKYRATIGPADIIWEHSRSETAYEPSGRKLADICPLIAPERFFWIFDLFVQGDQGLERRYGGLEIGLALVKRWVELHGSESPLSVKDRAEAANW